jgi:endoglucanase
VSSDQGAGRQLSRRTIVLAAAVVAVLVLAGIAALAWPRGHDGSSSSQSTTGESSSDNPLHGVEFYVDPESHAAQQVAEWRAAGRTADAKTLGRIANEPVAKWFGQDDVTSRVETLASSAETAGKHPLIVAYNIPHRDCGQYSSGGAESAAAYRQWIDDLAKGLAKHAATVILEPDAVAHTLDGCLDKSLVAERYGLLKYAVTTLTANPDVTVYVDAGNASWIKDVNKMIHALTQVGIEKAHGFALNVSNFETTEKTAEYGRKLSDGVGGAHFVIDTSRNGRGPYQQGDADVRWCNPPGRALGSPPTTDTGIDRVDAFLWIKQPGDSDGSCRDGAPEAGQWWADYALSLARS